MPASWLVTNPPNASSKKVAIAVSTANQCNGRLIFAGERAFIGDQGHYFAASGSNVKSTVALASLTSISWVFLPPLRCSATRVYLPGGTFLMVYLPSASLMEKYG